MELTSERKEGGKGRGGKGRGVEGIKEPAREVFALLTGC
jgi:hypothetical protein